MSGLGDRQVSLGGETFTLRYSFRAFGALQEHWQLATIDAVIGRLTSGAMGTDDLVGVIWAGLRTHHAGVSKEQVLDALDAIGIGGLPALVQDLQAAILAALPVDEKGAGTETGPRPPRA